MPPLYTPPGPLDALAEARRAPFDLYLDAWKAQGDLVRFQTAGRMWYLAVHPEAVRHVLQTNAANYRKPEVLLCALRVLLGDGLFSSEAAAWRRDRGQVQAAFSQFGPSCWVDAAGACADELVREWEQLPAGRVIDFSAHLAGLALRIIWRALLGPETPLDEPVISAALGSCLAYVHHRLCYPLSWPAWVPTARNRCFRGARRLLYRSLSVAITRTGTQATAAPVLTALLENRPRGTGPAAEDPAFLGLVLTLLLAAAESLGSSLTWTWGLLALHPDIGRELAREAVTVLGNRSARPEDLSRLCFARMVFQESLRLYPTGWAQPREALADDVLQGRAVPQGTVIVLFQYLTHRHPEFWERPDCFDPSRFDPALRSRISPFAYFPFGAGAHSCVGRAPSLLQGPLVLAALARRFLPRLLVDALPKPEGSFFLTPARPLLGTLHPNTEVAAIAPSRSR